MLSVRGGTLVDTSGHRVGRIEDIYFGRDTAEPEWALVTTGSSGSVQTFVPLADASVVGGKTLQVGFGSDRIMNAPRVDPEGELSETEEAVLYRHYGLSFDDSALRGAVSQATYVVDVSASTAVVEDQGRVRGFFLPAPGLPREQAEEMRGVLDRWFAEALATGPQLGAVWAERSLIDVMTPRLTPPAEVVVLQARRNAEARAELLNEFGALTSAQVAELGRSRAANRSAMAGRWRKEGRIFAVSHDGATLFPAFQFDVVGRPRPVLAEVIRHLGGVGTWELALWFTTRSERLGGARPVDLLDADPAAVAEAAEAVLEPSF